ncbi:MAG: diguanylate cyclase [Deltaproteobacteria bacterium]|nr:diguanylate cyclase [Deltaproteobacteria bacterium]
MFSFFRQSIARKIALTVGLACLVAVALGLAGAGLLYGSDLWQRAPLLVLGTGLLVIFVFSATVLAVRRYLGVPLRNVNLAIEKAEAGNFLTRLEGHGEDEMGLLVDDFNRLLAKLTAVQASKIDTDIELDIAQRELEFHAELEKKNELIEQTNQNLKKRLGELELLFQVTQALSSTLDPDRVIETIKELIGTTLGFHRFSILLMDEQREKLVIRSVFGPHVPGASAGDPVSLDEPLLAEAIRSGEPYLLRDTSGIERSSPMEKILTESSSFLSIPMRARDRFLGLLNFTRSGRDAFGPDEIKFLTSLARHSAMAILNAQLYQEKLELSVTDELTGLANRRLFQTRFEHEWNRSNRFSSPLSLLMVDIDHFKRYNDTNGHLLGDRVLAKVAKILQANTRKVDTLARYGGEEFIVLLPGQDKATAASVADKLRQAVSSAEFPRMHTQPLGHVSITLGVSTWPGDADNPRDLLDRADLAMYMAKRNGRNQVALFEEQMLDAESERQAELTKKKSRRRRRRRRPKAPPATRVR